MTEKQVLHQAEELGQGRPLTTEEIRALALMAAIAGTWGACVGLLVFNGFWLWKGHVLSLASLALPALAGLVMGSGAVLLVGGKEVIDGLRSWREAKTFVPSPSPPDPGVVHHDPILVRAGDKRALLDRQEPLALPSPGRQRLELTPDTLTVILKEIIEGHSGQWSRARIMGIKVDGRNVPRRLYESLTTTLSKAGLLSERSQGGFEFAIDIKTLSDLTPYFPGLDLTGTAGRMAGGQERGGLGDVHQVGGAERARARWLKREEV